jgi:hypothetical protein
LSIGEEDEEEEEEEEGDIAASIVWFIASSNADRLRGVINELLLNIRFLIVPDGVLATLSIRVVRFTGDAGPGGNDFRLGGGGDGR